MLHLSHTFRTVSIHLDRLAKLFDAIRVPLILLVFLAALEILSRFGIIPTDEEISLIIGRALDKYGLITIAPLAFLENLVGFNVYFPGSIVILTTMALSAGNPLQAVIIFLIYYLFAVFAYHIDFFASERLKSISIFGIKFQSQKLSKRNISWPLWLRFLVFFCHPQLASLFCVQLADEKREYSQIIKYLLVFTFGWTLFWSILMYSVGMSSGRNVDLKAFAYIYLFGLLVSDLYQYFRPAKTENSSAIVP